MPTQLIRELMAPQPSSDSWQCVGCLRPWSWFTTPSLDDLHFEYPLGSSHMQDRLQLSSCPFTRTRSTLRYRLSTNAMLLDVSLHHGLGISMTIGSKAVGRPYLYYVG